MTAALASRAQPRVRRPILWSLWVGAIIVGFSLGLAWLGPQLAPRDPLQDTAIIRVSTGKFLRPPFVPG